MKEKKRMTIAAWAEAGVACALALVLSYVEFLVPIPLPVPGLKLGLPNLVFLFLLYRRGLKKAALVSAVRLLLSSALFGSLLSLSYAAAGAVLSLSVMALLKKTGWFSPFGVSVAGGVTHNLGQVLLAAWVMRTEGILGYFPVLCLGGTLAGALIGLLGALLLRKLPETPYVRSSSDS